MDASRIFSSYVAYYERCFSSRPKPDYLPVFANYRLIAKVCIQVASTRDLNWKRRGRKKRKNRTDPVSVREPSVNKWEGGDIEMKQGGKSGFRATISGKIDELPVGGQPVLCP